MTHPSATLSPTQRRITLLRHAKAVPEDGLDDRSRVLSGQGREAATELGVWLKAQTMLPQLVLCSSAARTRETFAALAADVPVQFSDALYLASAQDMLTLLQGLDDSVHHVMVIAHNPGIHALAATLAASYVREADADQLASRYPTCGLVSMSVPAVSWATLSPASGTVDLLRFGSLD